MTCGVCWKTSKKPLVHHHYHGRKVDDKTMLVHDGACHMFGDFVTQRYGEAGRQMEVTPALIHGLWVHFNSRHF